jgi:hypothetical protein
MNCETTGAPGAAGRSPLGFSLIGVGWVYPRQPAKRAG